MGGTLGHPEATREEDKAVVDNRRVNPEVVGTTQRGQEGGIGVLDLELNEGMYHLESPHRQNHLIPRRTVLRQVGGIQHRTLPHRHNRIAKGS